MQSLSRGNEQFLWLQGQIKGLITETSLPGVPAVLIELKIMLLHKSDTRAINSIVSHGKLPLKYLAFGVTYRRFMELEFAKLFFS